MSKTKPYAVYPLFTFVGVLTLIILTLVKAKDSGLIVNLFFLTLTLVIFGCGRQLLRLALPFFVIGGLFCYITYAASGGNITATLAMEYRFWGLFLAASLGGSCSAVAMTRCLSTLKIPRGITLGMLVVMSFVPLLTIEMRRITEAMKTRCVGSALNPRVVYRGFLIPLCTQLVALSDTLSLSVETRGFALGGTPYTVYKPVKPRFKDWLFLVFLLMGVALLWL